MNIIEVYCPSYDIVWTDATTKRMDKQKCPKNIIRCDHHRSAVGSRPSKIKYSFDGERDLANDPLEESINVIDKL